MNYYVNTSPNDYWNYLAHYGVKNRSGRKPGSKNKILGKKENYPLTDLITGYEMHGPGGFNSHGPENRNNPGPRKRATTRQVQALQKSYINNWKPLSRVKDYGAPSRTHKRIVRDSKGK